jgi:hypothetical protein
MRELGQLLDRVLNNRARRTEGFILIRFPQGEPGRPLYIATCAPEESIKMLKLLLAQLEGRITGEEGHA